MGKRKFDDVLDENFDENGRSRKIYDRQGTEEEKPLEVRILGESIKEENEKKFYQSFEVDGNHYEIDDVVLIRPKTTNQMPSVAIIKKIIQGNKGNVQIQAQWFYRPEDAQMKGGGTWLSLDSRELFYSFDIDEVPAQSILHKCEVHFIPQNNLVLTQKQKYPGFVVHWVYDAHRKKLFNLIDNKDYEDQMQQEIDLLVEKTSKALKQLPSINEKEHVGHVHENVTPDLNSKKKVSAKKLLAPLHLTNEETNVKESEVQSLTPIKEIDNTKIETPTSTLGTNLELLTLLKNHNVLLGVYARDRWLEKLMQTIQNLCGGGKGFYVVNGSGEGICQGISDVSKEHNSIEVEEDKECLEGHKMLLGEGNLAWPKIALTAIEVISSIERLNHDSHKNDLHKYNLKMRQLDFNIKSNEVLARRLLTKELEPITILNMSPIELKDGYIKKQEEDLKPFQPEAIQMASARCSICTERKVGVIDIIHVSYGDRYQLECLKCGNTWYSATDTILSSKAANNIPLSIKKLVE